MNLQTCTRNHTRPFKTRMSVGTYLRVEKNAVRNQACFQNLQLHVYSYLSSFMSDLKILVPDVCHMKKP